MRRFIKKALIGVMSAAMLFTSAPMIGNAATVNKGSYDFSNMVVRRVWFNTDDPVFMIDNYQRVWLDKNANVLAKGEYKIPKVDNISTPSKSTLKAPMKEMFAQIGAEYSESGDEITITLNGDTLKLVVGSNDVIFKGQAVMDALTAEQIPQRVVVKDSFAADNTYLAEDYSVIYLPVGYILDKFQADIYEDGSVTSFYAAIPVFKTDNVPSYTTAAEGYGSGYDDMVAGTLEADQKVADNIVALQNADGGWHALPVDTDMAQDGLSGKIGTLKSDSTLLDGATTSELKYLAKYITESKTTDSKYADAFVKGIGFLTANQHESGAWQMSPTAANGFRSNLAIGNDTTVPVLELLSDIALLNDQNYVFARKVLNVADLQKTVNKGNDFLVASQMTNGEKKAGWASQYKTDGTVTMGRTYERESVSSFTTKAVAEYLMTLRNPSDKIQEAINSAVAWLDEVKLADKELKTVRDMSMNNGFDVYLIDGAGTWASNYVYNDAAAAYRPLYSDVDPKRPDQKAVNIYELHTVDPAKDLILYSTRTSLKYFDNELAIKLTGEDYSTWKGYLANGFPELPQDPKEETPTEPTQPTDPTQPTQPGTDNPTDGTGAPGSSDNGSGTATGDMTSVTLILFASLVSASLLGGYGYVVYRRKKGTKIS